LELILWGCGKGKKEAHNTKTGGKKRPEINHRAAGSLQIAKARTTVPKKRRNFTFRKPRKNNNRMREGFHRKKNILRHEKIGRRDGNEKER